MMIIHNLQMNTFGPLHHNYTRLEVSSRQSLAPEQYTACQKLEYRNKQLVYSCPIYIALNEMG